MRTATVVLFSLLFTLVKFTNQANLCQARYCPEGGDNIYCKGDSYSDLCPKDVRILTNSKVMTAFLAAHNEIRNQIALGEFQDAAQGGFPPALRMATMEEDGELSRQARILAKQCKTEKDECRNTDKFSYVGQNIYSTKVRGLNYDAVVLARKAVEEWTKEKAALTDVNVISAYVDSDAYRQFAQIIMDKATRIGCAISDFSEPDNSRTAFVVCNYASAPVDDEPVYAEGCALAQCLRGKNSNYPGLCHPSELIEPNIYAF